MVLSITLHAAKLTRHEQIKYGVKHMPVTKELEAILRPGQTRSNAGSISAIEQAVRDKLVPVGARDPQATVGSQTVDTTTQTATATTIEKASASPERAVKTESGATPAKRGRKPKIAGQSKVAKSAKTSPMVSKSALEHTLGQDAAETSTARPISSAPAAVAIDTATAIVKAEGRDTRVDGAATSLTDEEILAVYDGWRYYFRAVTGTELPPYKRPPMPGSEGGPHISPRWLGPSPPRNDARLSMLITQRQAVEMWRWHAEARLKLRDADAAHLRQKLAITPLAKHLVTVPITDEESLQLLDTHEWFDAAEAAYDASMIGQPSPMPPSAEMPAPRLYHQQLQQHHQQQAHWSQMTLPSLSLPQPVPIAHSLPPNLQSHCQHASIAELPQTQPYSVAHLPPVFSLNFDEQVRRFDLMAQALPEQQQQHQHEHQNFDLNAGLQAYAMSGSAQPGTHELGHESGAEAVTMMSDVPVRGELVLDFSPAAGAQQRGSVVTAASVIPPRTTGPPITDYADAERPRSSVEHGADCRGHDVTEDLQF